MYSNIKCLLYYFILPILPFLLSVIFLLVLKSYDNLYLCDGESIKEITDNLDMGIKKYKEWNLFYEHWKDKADMAEYSAILDSDDENENIINMYNKRAGKGLEETKKALIRIREIEESIKNMDSNFVSSIKKQDFEN